MSGLDAYKSLNVVVGLPSLGTVHMRSMLCLQAMLQYFMTQRVGNYKSQMIQVVNKRGSILANLRVDIVREAVARKASHILWVDSDQTYPKETLHRLILRDVDVVAANVATKQIPAHPTARRLPGPAEPPSGAYVFSDPESPEMQKVWRVGTGIMLVKMKVYREIGLNVFGQPWREDWQKYQGEDWTMCEAMEAGGFDIWVDHRLSREVGHLGDYEYTHDVVGELVEVPNVAAA